MGKSQKAEAPPPTPTQGQQYADWITQYSKFAPERRTAELGDAGTQADIAKQYLPQMIQLESDLAPAILANRMQQAQDIGTLAPVLKAATEDPQTEAIRAMLGKQIEQELAAGSTLDPAMLREVEQGTRAGQSARGTLRGTSAIAQEAMARGTRGQQLRSSRQQAADNFLRTQAATAFDPYAATQGLGMTRNSQAFSSGMPQMAGSSALTGQAMNAGTQAAMQNNMLQYNTNQLNAANKPKYGGLAGMGLGAGAGFLVGGPVGVPIGAFLGGAVGSASGF